MMHHRHTFLVLLHLLISSIFPAAMSAQVSNGEVLALSHASISITTDPDSARIILDGRLVGTTPLTLDSLTPGSHALTAQHPDVASWFTPTITDTILVCAGESRRLHFDFPRRLLVSSSPFGAHVSVGDSVYGTTPLLLRVAAQLPGASLRIQKDGYEPIAVDLDSIHQNAFTTALKPVWPREALALPVLDDGGSGNGRNLKLYITGTATLLSGVAAAYFKTQADERFIAYSQTGDPAVLSETHRLDKAAGITLAATQIGFALFTYFLLSE